MIIDWEKNVPMLNMFDASLGRLSLICILLYSFFCSLIALKRVLLEQHV